MNELKEDWKETDEVYESEGSVSIALGDIMQLVIVVAVIVVAIIFTNLLVGQTYNLVEDDITSITNTTVSGYIQDSIGNGIQAMTQVSGYVPIVMIAVIISIVLSLIVGFLFVGGGAMGGTMGNQGML